MKDPIADMIVRIKNAGMVHKPVVTFPASELKFTIAEKLKQVGYLKSVTKKGKKVKKTIEAELIYHDGKAKINDVRRVSKPSRRIYHRHHQVHAVRQGHGLAIYSTPAGILTDKEAREQKVGGEILFKIW